MNCEKGIIFDMDGVLVDSEKATMIVSIKSLERFGVKPVFDDFNEFTGMGEDMFIGGVARKHGLEYSPEMKEYAYGLYVKEAKDLVFVFPNVKTLLERLKSEGFVLAVASAADYIKVKTNLECIGMDISFFDAVITGSDVKNKKPHPEIFIHTAEKIGIMPQNCIVAEDALSGITAAKSAGMACIAVTTSFDEKTLKTVEPNYIVKDLNEAYDKIHIWSGAEKV